MKNNHKKRVTKNKLFKSSVFFGVASLFWFIFRTGTKPSRIVYPCQRAALTNVYVLLGLAVPLSLVTFLVKTEKFLSRIAKPLALVTILAIAVIDGGQFLGSFRPAGAVNPNQEIQLTLESRNATALPASSIYVVSGPEHAHISELINLLNYKGLPFYNAGTSPNGLIARNDVVLIKINSQWPERGGTNTDVLKEIIQAIVNYPDGFVGEIVVADNAQGFQGSMDWPNGNAEDTSQSTQDVVNMFSSTYHVSTFRWDSIRGTRVNEYSTGDMTSGYIVYSTADPATGIVVSYPKFRTQFGTYISFKNGVWNGTAYEKRLKVINLPVLKSHKSYGVSACLKNYMGVVSEGERRTGGLANGHYQVATGGMGTLMVETGLPTLNIIDAIWVNANPPPASNAGAGTPYAAATRVNVLMASTDPVAIDYWAAKHVLVQAAGIIGYNDTRTLDPDNTDKNGVWEEAFGVWLKLTKDQITAAGYNVTTDENHMNVYVNDQSNGDSTPPSIGTPSQNPLKDNVMPDQEVQVSVNVTDTESQVKNVTLFFTINNGTSWENRTMNYNLSTSLYEATIPGQQAETWVEFKIVAYDNAGNIATKDGAAPYCTYQVIPEFTSFIMFPIFVAATLLAVILLKRKRTHGEAARYKIEEQKKSCSDLTRKRRTV